MKFKVEISGTNVILSYEQLDLLAQALSGSERVEEKWVGDRSGPNKSNYVRLIRPYLPGDLLRAQCVTDDEYGALSLVTKLEDEKNGAS